MSNPAQQVIHDTARSLFPETWKGNRFHPDFTPVLLGSLYARAAAMIGQRGYDRHAPSWQDDGGPLALAGAVRLAAVQLRPDDKGDAADLEEEALTRLGGILYVTGQRQFRTLGTGGDIADAPGLWDGDDDQPSCGPGDAECPAAKILSAAALLMTLTAMQ